MFVESFYFILLLLLCATDIEKIAMPNKKYVDFLGWVFTDDVFLLQASL
jgi:hypothetical protein